MEFLLNHSGLAIGLLGAGRMTKTDVIDPAAGIILAKKTGDHVREGELLCTLYADREALLDPAQEKFLSAVSFGNEAPAPQPLIYKVIH